MALFLTCNIRDSRMRSSVHFSDYLKGRVFQSFDMALMANKGISYIRLGSRLSLHAVSFSWRLALIGPEEHKLSWRAKACTES